MARRADHTREELTDIAIEAGLELIKKEGFSNFSARKVAAQIGYTVGTLYNVFGSYDAMILHINARTLDEWFDVMQTALMKNRRANPLHVLAKAYVEYSRKHYHQWIALFEHHLDKDCDRPEWYTAKMTRFFALIEGLLLPLVHSNHNKAQQSARILWAGIHGICILSLSGKLDVVKADSAEILALSFIDNYVARLALGGKN